MGGEKRWSARRCVLISLLSAMALVAGVLESLFPLPFPGMRLGVANIFPLTALLMYGPADAAAVAALRLCLAFFLSGSVFSLSCSAAGVMLSLPVAIILREKFSGDLSVPAISVASAFAFNFGQVAAVVAMTGEPAIAVYLPLLLLAAALTGFAVGVLAEKLVDRLRRLSGNPANLKSKA
ncbi:MAG: Gx transporter family protein [Synergistaceae bacterium]|jgi:heptaprenyl diphosphate synthase|nr:Gx transporter family protein [Synergistaceae bacterium]